MSRYNRVFLIVNNPGFGGQCTGYQWFSVDEGNETVQMIGGTPYNVRLMSCAFCNEWLKDSYWPTASGNTRDEGAAVAAHEMGHELEIPIHYSDVNWSPNDTRDSVSPWDIMGLSPTWNNYFAWSKFKMGWLPIANIQNVGPATTSTIDTTVTLNPLHATTGRRGIKIPFSTSEPYNGYYVEYRKQVDPGTTRWYGGQVLDDGVLVTLIDDRPEVPFGDKAQVMYNPLHSDDPARAMLRVGESYVDAGRGITITCTALGTTASVHIVYAVPPTDVDPAITPWSAPPYESPDIWIDSEQNGWGTYRYVDSGGRPIGNGDPAWVRQLPDNSWKVNRVMVRVRNYGLDPVTNVFVNVYVNDPPGLGDRGANWAYLGSINYPSIPGGGSAIGYVNWAPQVDRHTCLRAVIVPYTNERTGSNNQAQENVSNFETTASSPYQPVTLKMRVQNPTKLAMPTEFQVDGIPRKWKWELEPRSLTLDPDGEGFVTLTLYPPNPATNPLFVQGQIFVPRITALMPHGDAFAPVGGVELWTHLVYKDVIVLDSLTRASPTSVRAKGHLMSLQPSTGPLAGQKVAVSINNMNRDKTTSYVLVTRTNSDGNFVVTFGNLSPGTWDGDASWAGNMKYQSGESNHILIGL
jgi:hypothetical protein